MGIDAGIGVVTANSVICIGTGGDDVSDTTWIGNIYGVTTQSGTTAPVIVSADGQLGTVGSSERFKKDIAFKSNQGSKDQEGHPVYGDLKHYKVEVERHGQKLEVVFVPEWAPTEKPHPGGSTDYGWEVHYIIALDQMKILEEHYAR